MDADMMAVIADVITALAAATAAGAAVLGLDTWEVRLRGRDEYDLARRILRATYRVRDEIARVRNPLMVSGEISQALEEAGVEPEPGPGSHSRANEAVYQQRWEGLAEAMSDLQVEQREAEVLWGRGYRDVFRPLRECISDLWIAIHRYLRAQASDTGPLQTSQLSAEDRKEVYAVIYQLSPDPAEDAFTGRVTEAVEEVEERVRPHLEISRSLLARMREKLRSS